MERAEILWRGGSGGQGVVIVVAVGWVRTLKWGMDGQRTGSMRTRLKVPI